MSSDAKTIENYIQREHCYLSKISEQEREIQKYKNIANDIQTRFEEGFEKTSLRLAMVDPTVNMEILRLRQRMKAKDDEIGELKREIASTTFKPTSISGQKLMKKCRTLLEENQSLGRQISEGPIQDLLIALGFEKEKVRLLKQKLKERDEFCEVSENENERLVTALEILSRKYEFALSSKGVTDAQLAAVDPSSAFNTMSGSGGRGSTSLGGTNTGEKRHKDNVQTISDDESDHGGKKRRKKDDKDRERDRKKRRKGSDGDD